MKKLFTNTFVLLLLAVFVGLLAGTFIPSSGMEVLLVVKEVCGQVIFFLVPLIIIGFVAPSIATLQGNVSRLIVLAFGLAYVSSVGAAGLAAWAGYQIVPWLEIESGMDGLRELPQVLFHLEIPPVMSVMSALLLSVLVGLGAIWIASKEVTVLLAQFQQLVLQIVKRVLIPLLPVYVAANFCALAYEGSIGRLKVFLPTNSVRLL